MAGIISVAYLFLLQERYFKEDNPIEGMILLIAIGAIIVFAVIFQIIRYGTNKSFDGKSKTKGPATPRKFSPFTFRRVASSYGLDGDQTKLLEFVFKNDGVTDPERVMKNLAVLDRHFKKAFKSIERNSSTDEDVQQNLTRLFNLRNAIESAPSQDDVSNVQLVENTPAIVGVGKESYPVKVLLTRGQNVVTEFPKNILGSPIRLPKGTRVTLSFFTKSSSGFSYDGQVSGSTNIDRRQGLQITHNGKIKPLVKRRFRRREIDLECEFYPVKLEETGTGRKKTTRLVVDTRRFTGTLQDISAGGCSIKTGAPIQIGSRLKITIEHDDAYPLTVLGQAIRSNRSSQGTIIHIKFLKVPQRAFNTISTIVFGYNDD